MLALNVSLNQLQAFLLIFLRVGAILFSAPIIDNKSIPVLFKIGLAISISLLMYPVLKIDTAGFEGPLIYFFFKVMVEIAIGFIIGLTVHTIFAGIQLAGQIAGFQMGISIANVMDPATSMQIPILAQFTNIFAVLIFLSTNMHHWFFRALAESFALIPPLGYRFNGPLLQPIIELTANIFVVGVKVGAPVMSALLLSSVALGLLARTVPQMNIFVVAMPAKILIGLFFLGIELPFLSAFLIDTFYALGKDLILLIRNMA
jgi:flagellar biosynthetic protein FliR